MIIINKFDDTTELTSKQIAYKHIMFDIGLIITTNRGNINGGMGQYQKSKDLEHKFILLKDNKPICEYYDCIGQGHLKYLDTITIDVLRQIYENLTKEKLDEDN